MKVIQLKEVNLVHPVTNEVVNPDNKTYGFLISTCINNTPKKGWTVAEMKNSLKVQAKVDAANNKNADTLDLEDAEFEYFYTKLTDMAWGLKDKQIVEFQDYIDRIKQNGNAEHNQPVTTEGE